MKAKKRTSVLFVMCMKIACKLQRTKVWHLINAPKKWKKKESLSWQLKQLIKSVMSSKWPMRAFKKRQITDMGSQHSQLKASRTNYWANHLTASHTKEGSHTCEQLSVPFFKCAALISALNRHQGVKWPPENIHKTSRLDDKEKEHICSLIGLRWLNPQNGDCL